MLRVTSKLFDLLKNKLNWIFASDINMVKVNETLKQTIEERGMDGWETLYQIKETPWDLKGATPAIKEFLENQKELPNDVDSVFVPGCGVGYDVIEFSKYVKQAIGMDLSPSAISLANQNKKAVLSESDAKKVEFILDDFYTKSLSEFPPIDLIFDYTFLCAMQPKMRDPWANRMNQILRPKGYLLTLMFPLSKHEGGPPFALSVEIYEQLLSENFNCLWIRSCLSVEHRDGKEKLALWKKKH